MSDSESLIMSTLPNSLCGAITSLSVRLEVEGEQTLSSSAHCLITARESAPGEAAMLFDLFSRVLHERFCSCAKIQNHIIVSHQLLAWSVY